MKLKPCPFCGGEAKTWDMPVDANTISYQFGCSNCGMVAYFDYLDEKESIEAWNRREPIDKVVEQLEEASYWTEPTYDEYGYSYDDEIEVIDLSDAIEIVKSGGKA